MMLCCWCAGKPLVVGQIVYKPKEEPATWSKVLQWLLWCHFSVNVIVVMCGMALKILHKCSCLLLGRMMVPASVSISKPRINFCMLQLASPVFTECVLCRRELSCESNGWKTALMACSVHHSVSCQHLGNSCMAPKKSSM